MKNPWQLAFFLLLIITISAGAYYYAGMQNGSPGNKLGIESSIPNLDLLTDEEGRGLHSSIRATEDDTLYQNWIYRYSLTFPNSWGDIKERVDNGPDGSKIYQTIRLTAQNDDDRYIQINIVRSEHRDDASVTDAPHTLLSGDNVWTFYYSGGGDFAGMPGLDDQKYFDIDEEVDDISETFTKF